MLPVHVALLVNTAWLDEELASFHYLMVGLIDDQVRVAQVMPHDLLPDESSMFGERLTWYESRLRLVNRFRIANLDSELGRLGVNLIHALDGGVWAGAAVLAEATSTAVIFTACSNLDVAMANRVSRRLNPLRMAFTTSTEPIGQAISQQVDRSILVQTIAPGVHRAAELPHHRAEGPLCAVVSGNGVMDDHYAVLLEGLAEFCRHHPQSQFFFDGQGSDQHRIWKAASRLGLLSNLSLVPRRLLHRELLLRADVLIHPQPLGRSRTVTLQAMAHGLPVVAHHDPWLDYLVDGQTAWLVDSPGVAQWADCLARLIRDPAAGRELGRRAQAWVRRHRLASDQIASLLNLYRRMTGATIEFPR